MTTFFDELVKLRSKLAHNNSNVGYRLDTAKGREKARKHANKTHAAASLLETLLSPAILSVSKKKVDSVFRELEQDFVEMKKTEADIEKLKRDLF